MIIKGTYLSKGASEVILECDFKEKYTITRADAKRLGFLELNDDDFPIEFQDEELIEHLSQKLKAIHYCNYLLSFSDKSVRVLRQKLKEKEYTQEVIDECLEVLQKNGVVNDNALCREKYLQIASSKLYGPARIKNELFAKGFSFEDIKNAESELELDFEELLTELCQKLLKNGKTDLSDKVALEKFKAKLIRYGYSFSQISSVLKSFDTASDFD